MTATITVPKEYGWVLGVSAVSFLVCAWHGTRVGGFRKASKTPYPNAYVSAEAIATCPDAKEKHAKYLFNCAQRAHGNFLENYPMALAGMLISGLQFPVTSAVTGAIWLTSRIAYATGYTDPNRNDGKGRYAGGMGQLFWVCQVVWMGLVGKMGFDLVMS